jgi:hypothetical protein
MFARIGVMPHKPIFCLVLREGERWQVEAEWPDGTIELIDTFKAHFDALHGSKLDRLAMRGPARVLIRYFLNVPRSHGHEYYSARTRDGGSISQGLEGS